MTNFWEAVLILILQEIAMGKEEKYDCGTVLRCTDIVLMLGGLLEPINPNP